METCKQCGGNGMVKKASFAQGGLTVWETVWEVCECSKPSSFGEVTLSGNMSRPPTIKKIAPAAPIAPGYLNQVSRDLEAAYKQGKITKAQRRQLWVDAMNGKEVKL